MYPPDGNQHHLKTNTNEIFGNMSRKGGGGHFDGIVQEGTFESNLEKLTDVVKDA